MALRTLVVSLEARTAAFERGLTAADRKIANFERSMQRVQRVLLAGAAGGALVAAAKKLFDLGAAAEETRNKFETVFGAATAAVRQFGDDWGRVAGLSNRQFQEMAGTVGAVAQGMGFAEAQSAQFSQQILRLAGDLASFNNLQTDDVIQRMTAALTGERESMKRLGIVITEVEVQQRAFANTGKTVAAQLTQQEKATATLELITQKAGKAVGDLARTQDSAANQVKRIRAEFQTIAEDFATKMLPALAAMLPALQALIPPLARLAELTAQFVSGLALTSPRIARAKETADRIAAERASFAGLGDKALPGARDRYNREIQRLTGQLGALNPRSFDGPNTVVDNLVAEIRAYGELVATINRRLATAAGDTADVAAGAARAARRTLDGLGADRFGFRVLNPQVGAFGPSRGPGSPYAFRGTSAVGITPDTEYWDRMMANKEAFNDIADASVTATEANDALTRAMNQGAAAMGAMVEAVAYGSATMEQAVVAAITSMVQAAIQLKAQQIGSLAGPLGTLVGTIGGLIVSSMADRPQPVRLVSVDDAAAAKLERGRTGPDRVQLYVVDARGNVREIRDLLNRAQLRDAVPRLSGVAA